MLIRGDLTIVPNEHIITKENDILIVRSDKLVKPSGKPKKKNKLR